MLEGPLRKVNVAGQSVFASEVAGIDRQGWPRYARTGEQALDSAAMCSMSGPVNSDASRAGWSSSIAIPGRQRGATTVGAFSRYATARRRTPNRGARIATDQGAARLGEVALVDGNSPVARSGRVFGEVLFDENATCHIALGQAYAFTVPDLPDDPDERHARGFNTSAIHQDIMIGGREISVDGIDAAGTSTPILRDDAWVPGPWSLWPNSAMTYQSVASPISKPTIVRVSPRLTFIASVARRGSEPSRRASP